MPRFLQALDPRRSLATAVAWLAVALSLAVTLAMLAVGDFAINSMLVQRDALMARFARNLASEVEHALDEAALADRATDPSEALGELLSAPRMAELVERVRAQVKPDPRVRVLLLDERDDVRFGWPAASLPGAAPLPMNALSLQADEHGQRIVVLTAPGEAAPGLRALGMKLAVLQPSEEGAHGGTLQEKLAAMSILLSIVAALVGVGFARHLTRRLGKLAAKAQQVALHDAGQIIEPQGHDEVAVLGRAFVRLLQSLRSERDELDRLSHELEERVQARTREVERLAADSRYAAVVRERLRLARDLHDTLAHSMMAMLVEVRMLRKLHTHDPGRLAGELERAEGVALEGLKEVRDAVSQMRLNAVRDLGLGAALGSAIARFSERTGLDVNYDADPQAASFADPRAETVFRIADEALRNIDRHAQASRVDVSLRDAGEGAIELTITDDGVGFDPAAPHPGHYGVVGIREQAQLIDAELDLQSRPGAGAKLRLRLAVGPELAGLRSAFGACPPAGEPDVPASFTMLGSA